MNEYYVNESVMMGGQGKPTVRLEVYTKISETDEEMLLFWGTFVDDGYYDWIPMTGGVIYSWRLYRNEELIDEGKMPLTPGECMMLGLCNQQVTIFSSNHPFYLDGFGPADAGA